MENIVIALLEANMYKVIEDAPRIGVFTYESQELKDVIIVAKYTTGDLNVFDESDVTYEVMRQFDQACKGNPSALKDTSLIICHSIADTVELEESKNISLKIEENAFGFRKYVLPYTADSIQELVKVDAKEIPQTLAQKLQIGFSDYAESSEGKDVSEYETILQLYSKLPFLNYIREDNDWVSLETFLEGELDGSERTREMVGSYKFSSSETFDQEIDTLLADDGVKEFISGLRRSEDEA